MNKISSKIDLAANILIIIVAVLFGIFLIQKIFLPSPVTVQQTRIKPIVGTKVNLPKIDWSTHDKTVILVLQTTCHFCTESVPFYKRLSQEAKAKNIRLVAVFPTTVEESTAYPNKLGLSGIEVKQSPLFNLQVSGTPTLILSDNKGEVLNFWVGKLQPEQEQEVINKL